MSDSLKHDWRTQSQHPRAVLTISQAGPVKHGLVQVQNPVSQLQSPFPEHGDSQELEGQSMPSEKNHSCNTDTQRDTPLQHCVQRITTSTHTASRLQNNHTQAETGHNVGRSMRVHTLYSETATTSGRPILVCVTIAEAEPSASPSEPMSSIQYGCWEAKSTAQITGCEVSPSGDTDVMNITEKQAATHRHKHVRTSTSTHHTTQQGRTSYSVDSG
jgi:hypothetical protein